MTYKMSWRTNTHRGMWNLQTRTIHSQAHCRGVFQMPRWGCEFVGAAGNWATEQQSNWAILEIFCGSHLLFGLHEFVPNQTQNDEPYYSSFVWYKQRAREQFWRSIWWVLVTFDAFPLCLFLEVWLSICVPHRISYFSSWGLLIIPNLSVKIVVALLPLSCFSGQPKVRLPWISGHGGGPTQQPRGCSVTLFELGE